MIVYIQQIRVAGWIRVVLSWYCYTWALTLTLTLTITLTFTVPKARIYFVDWILLFDFGLSVSFVHVFLSLLFHLNIALRLDMCFFYLSVFYRLRLTAFLIFLSISLLHRNFTSYQTPFVNVFWAPSVLMWIPQNHNDQLIIHYNPNSYLIHNCRILDARGSMTSAHKTKMRQLEESSFFIAKRCGLEVFQSPIRSGLVTRWICLWPKFKTPWHYMINISSFFTFVSSIIKEFSSSPMLVRHNLVFCDLSGFPASSANISIPPVNSAKDFGDLPNHTAFTSSVHSRDVASTPIEFMFIAQRPLPLFTISSYGHT